MDTFYTLSVESKSMEHFEFVKNHFDCPVDIGYNDFMEDTSKYVIGVRIEGTNIPCLIGVSMFKMLDDKINIDYVAIDKEFRRRGINRSINELIEEIATGNYIDLLTANIRETNTNSINSFLKCGFVICNNEVLKYNNGEIKIHVYKKII